MNCQHCQPLLLDHLYDLLDGPDEAAVAAHLATCPACAAARADTARVQGLIARAAKSAFPATRFEPPAEPPAKVGTVTPAPATPAMPRPPARPGRGVRAGAVLSWAVAAAVLVAIPGTVVPVLNTFDRAELAKAEADAARREADLFTADVAGARAAVARRQTDAEFKVTAAEQAQTALLNNWVESQKALTAPRALTVDVQKPATVQPGAPNDFVVVVNDRREPWEQTGKRMVAEVHAVGASDAVIFTQPLDSERAADKTHALRLPAGAWTKVAPDAELFLVVAQVDEKTQARTELLERVKLAGPVYTTLLVTDKAAYRPGERLFFRSLTLDRATLRPPGREQVLQYDLLYPGGRPVTGLRVTGTTDLVRVGEGGRVEPVRAADGTPVRGVGSGEFVLPPDLADGEYTLVLHEQFHPGGYPAAVAAPVARRVTVRSAPPDDFRKLLGFARESFAPGETVEAWAELTFMEKAVPNAEVLAVTAEADRRVLDRVEAQKATDANGRATFRFALPADLDAGDVRVKVTFRTPRGTEEVVARQVPVVGRRVNVEFFPECGDALVAGVPCKVYARATTPAGIPVAIRGAVTDGRRELARVESLNDPGQPGANRGLASFTYTPELGTRAWLKLESPAGAVAPLLPDVPVTNASVALLGGPAAATARTGFPLPPVTDAGVVMSVLDPVTAPGQPIRVRLHSVGQPRQLVVGAYTRGRLSDTQKVTVDPDLPQTLSLMAGADPRGGVVRVTAFEEVEEKNELRPVAERLVFRKPGEALNIACGIAPADGKAAAAAVAPTATAAPTLPAGSEVRLSLTATDEKGNPAAAILWAAAVNTGAAPGPRDRLMPTHFLLAGEVKRPDDLEYADFLLTDHPKAAEALDLLLGTQGWRRFAEQRAAPDAGRAQAAMVAPGSPAAEISRLRHQNGQYAVPPEPQFLRENRKLVEKFAPKYEAAVQALAQARAKRDEARAAARNPQPVRDAEARAEEARRAAAERAARADAAREPVRQFRAGAWFAVGGLFLLAAACGVVAAVRPPDRFPLGFSTLGALGLAAFLLVAAGRAEDARAATRGGEAAQVAGAAPAPKGAPPGVVEMFAPPAAPASGADAVGAAGAPAGPNRPPADAPGKVGPTAFAAPAPAMSKMDPKPPWAGGGLPLPSTPGGIGATPGPKPPRTNLLPADPPKPAALGGPVVDVATDGGWEPHRPNGVSRADLLAGRPSPPSFGSGTPARAAEQAAELRSSADRAAAYAKDRANTLASPLDAYIQDRKRTGPAVPEAATIGPAAVDKLADAEQFAVGQIRGSVARPLPPLVVREYAAPRPSPSAPDADADTVLWQPVVVLPADGKATLTFHLGAAPGGYQVVVAGHTADGRLGAVRGLIRTAPTLAVAPVAPAAPPAR